LKLLLQVSPDLKLQILKIIDTLLHVNIPMEVFDTSLEGITFFTEQEQAPKVVFANCALASYLYGQAFRIRRGEWTNSMCDEPEGGLYDVSVHLIRIVGTCLTKD